MSGTENKIKKWLTVTGITEAIAIVAFRDECFEMENFPLPEATFISIGTVSGLNLALWFIVNIMIGNTDVFKVTRKK